MAKRIGQVMIVLFAAALVSAMFVAHGILALLVIGGALFMVGWVVVAVNLVTGHDPFES